MHPRITGLIAAPHTPMSDDFALRLETIERQAELLVQRSVAGAFVGGTTGESLSLSMEERLELAKHWVDVAGGSSFQVILHVGGTCLPDSRALAAQAHRLGADAVSVMAPCFFKPTTVEDLINFCALVARQAPDLPVYYYDIPSMTGVRLSPSELLERGRKKIPNLRGLKFSNPDMVQLQQCLRCADGEFEVLFGCDEALLAALALGVRGAVGCTYNFASQIYHDVIRAFERNDLETARQLQYRTVQMVRLLQQYGFLAASKHVMSLVGVDCGPVRPPLRDLTIEQKIELSERFEQLQITSCVEALSAHP